MSLLLGAPCALFIPFWGLGKVIQSQELSAVWARGPEFRYPKDRSGGCSVQSNTGHQVSGAAETDRLLKFIGQPA